MNPPLKWAGGKRWQLPYLMPMWQPHRHLVEPFCGGLSVALGLEPERASLNDINPHVINFYKWVQYGLNIVIPMENDKDMFYAHRARFNQLTILGQEKTHEAASLFYYLNRTCFNGLCRFNKSGGFNVPFGSYSSINYTREFPKLPKEWKFSCGDFTSLDIKPDDFIYADPPYDVEFTTYSKGGFGWGDQMRVAILLSSHSGPVILANQATPRIINLYQSFGFNLTFLEAPRRISCSGDRTPAREVLATRNIP